MTCSTVGGAGNDFAHTLSGRYCPKVSDYVGMGRPARQAGLPAVARGEGQQLLHIYRPYNLNTLPLPNILKTRKYTSLFHTASKYRDKSKPHEQSSLTQAIHGGAGC